MKKLLLPLLISLSTTIFTLSGCSDDESLAKTPESLFGVYINDNVLDYITKEELKSKVKDRARGFYVLRLKNPPVSNKDYSDKLWVKIDKNNKIASIQSEKYFRNFENCKKVEYSVRRSLETKYNILFVRYNRVKLGFEKFVGDKKILTQCKVHSDVKITLYTILQTKKYSDIYDEYLRSKI